MSFSTPNLHRTPTARSHSGGMTLIEVLVTLVIISVGLLGVAALQLTTVRNNYDSFVRSQAAVLASEMLDRMRVNRAQALGGLYVIGLGETATAASRAQLDMGEWKTTLATQLPAGGDGAIAFNAATQIVTITIQWGERDAATPLVQFVTTSQI